MTLANEALIAFLATTDAARSRSFYEGTLGLRIVEDTALALVVDAGGTMLRIQKVNELHAQPFTALGWKVPDIYAVVQDLSSKGVVFERYEFLAQDDDAVWAAPGGAKIAWFKDPDGNTLSLSQF